MKRIALILAIVLCARVAWTQASKASYPAMAPLAAYVTQDREAEIALARSAGPASIAKDADVMVLTAKGYVTPVHGTNGFVCIVQRSWAKPTVDAEFWNPKMRAPNCFNAAAATSFLQIYLLKTRLVLEGKSKAEVLKLSAAALDDGTIPPLAPGSMAYMMSKQQYLSDDDRSWHPHSMFFVGGDHEKGWGADKADSPVMAGNDPEERVTILFVLADMWSDGTSAPAAMMH